MNETTQPISLTDLLKNNLIQYKGQIMTISGYLTSFKIDTIFIKSVIDGGEIAVKTNDISGIPITEEWLEKLGFTLKDYEWIWTEDLNLFFTLNHFYVSTEDVDYPVSKRINYVHELQNAFYWITGTELTIK